MERYLGILDRVGPASFTATYLTDRKPRFDWTIEIVGSWDRGTEHMYVLLVPSRYNEWWKKSLKVAREYGWGWETLFAKFRELFYDDGRGVVFSKYGNVIRDEYIHKNDDWEDRCKFNYIIAFDKLKEGWDRGPYYNLSNQDVLLTIQY